MKDKHNNLKKDAPVAGSDLFADSESFLNELTDSEIVPVEGAPSVTNSNLSLLLCDLD